MSTEIEVNNCFDMYGNEIFQHSLLSQDLYCKEHAQPKDFLTRFRNWYFDFLKCILII